ncbi:ATP synthase F1 subcomplex epsilon subunit [Hydrogenispora ethanolica]|uniref:ATP synthase epsilon chain n=1 Tax=Hydrogenispora ethanolica TaxID=1082276 RepID=A0A4R1RB98_HYDET|nr:ATP synthase F1 subunit epsilon [Hydrogenispora ethanolica]TCL63018.1 ATP synthase F1 subcomplex epsilon subunit [Hydrogenispora ethanolica]
MPEKPQTKRIWLEVVTPSKLELRKEVEYVVVPTIDGIIGILPGHIRLMTPLATGVLRYKIDNQDYYMAVSEGYLEVTPHKVIVLAEAADLPEEIDVQQALAEKRKAEAEMYKPFSQNMEIALSRAISKLEVARKTGQKIE